MHQNLALNWKEKRLKTRIDRIDRSSEAGGLFGSFMLNVPYESV